MGPSNFEDYRDFLKSRYDELKKQNRQFSVNACARKAGISKSLLQFVFKKERHLSLDRIPLMARTLKLTSDETSFLCFLACKNVSRSPEIKDLFDSMLNRLRDSSEIDPSI
jgi:uncharacterized protein (TIGR02147 family)